MVISGVYELPKPKAVDQGKSVVDAIDSFLQQEKDRGIGDSTLKSFRKFLCGNPKRNLTAKYSTTLVEFAMQKGYTYLSEFTPDDVTEFRNSWLVRRRALTAQHERLKQFFKHAEEMRWIPTNPAKSLKPPKVDKLPVTAFSKEEIGRLLKVLAADDYLMTFNLVLRYSGLATVDAIMLKPSNLHGDHIRTKRQKTKKRVSVKIPPQIAARLRALPVQSGGYWFWNRTEENSKHETATGNMRRMMRKHFKEAKVYVLDEDGQIVHDDKNKPVLGHLYQWRHTFVNEQLISGTKMQRIAELIGDSLTTVMKTYAHFISDRQKPLDEDVEKSWNLQELASY